MGLKRQMPILYAAPCLATAIALYPLTAAQLKNCSSHAAHLAKSCVRGAVAGVRVLLRIFLPFPARLA